MKKIVIQRSSSRTRSRAILRRVTPPLAFAVALCLLVVCCYDWGHTGLPPTEKRYVAAKTAAASLLRDSKKSSQREPWERLAAEFRSIYDTDPAWPNRPAALLRAAETLEELAKRSCSRADAKKAIACYESLALKHASSRLADDALFRAARLRASQLKDEKGALTLLARLKKQYPKGDMVREAEALEKALIASANGKTAPAAVRELSAATTGVEPAEESRSAKSSFAGDLPLRLKAAKSRMAALRSDGVRACWRQPWEELRDEFLRVAKAGKTRLAPSAYMEAAACDEAIAACSRLGADRKKAANAYLEVQKLFPNHPLADDALLAAARLQRDTPGARKNCLATLDLLLKKYPKGDKAADAKKLKSLLGDSGDTLAAIKPPLSRRASLSAEKPELQVLSWDSPNKNCVRIALELSAPTKFTTRLAQPKKGRPASVFLDLQNAAIVDDVRKGVTVQGSLLKAVRVNEQKNGGATLRFDFSDISKFDTRVESNPHRIILTAAAGRTPLPPADNAIVSAKAEPVKSPAKVGVKRLRQVSDMASQLGLTVQRVFIDAGHGGKDPGTSHNKVVERAVTLDVAMALGRLLQANGLEVVYSRTRDRAVPLSERVRMANAAGADLFVSVHVNANDNPAANGMETYFLDLASTPQAARVAMMENSASDRRLGDMQNLLADVMLNARADESRRLARDIQKASQFRLKKRSFATRDNGVKSAPFHVLVGAKMPAVLVELGYCTNPAEAKNLASQAYRHALAEGLAEGVLAYRDRLLRNRTAGASLTKKVKGAM